MSTRSAGSTWRRIGNRRARALAIVDILIRVLHQCSEAVEVDLPRRATDPPGRLEPPDEPPRRGKSASNRMTARRAGNRC